MIGDNSGKGKSSLKRLPQVEELRGNFIIVLNSLDLKVTNREKWLRRKWGKRPRKGWVKIHVAFDLQSRQVVELKVTNERNLTVKRVLELRG